ncbi:MAG: hypothetical protein KDC33_03355 [Thermoleophilia bacterium]|nr:hypothetical protein [Thermoleophilia bacterium]
MTLDTETDPQAVLDRARSDYLAVSRGGHLFASQDEHRRAEELAWDRLQAAERVASAARTAA